MATSTPAGSRTTLDDVLAVLASGVQVWIDGGWGVDALLGEQTREHGDLDVAVEARHLDALSAALREAGYAEVGEPSATPWNFLLAHPRGSVVDLHVVVLDTEGNGVLGPPADGNSYPAGALTGRGVLGGRAVDCIAPEWVVRFRDAYSGDADDRADVRAVCARFDLEVPAQYR